MRRRFAVIAIACLGMLIGGVPQGGASTSAPYHLSGHAASIHRAEQFLVGMLDRHGNGTTPRLVQSYVPSDSHTAGLTTSFTYDDAVVIDAFLATHTQGNLGRAETIGNALLIVQRHDKASDGRLRAGYAPRPLTSVASIHVTSSATDVGNMAWVGMALARLAVETGKAKYLSGARAIADWVAANDYDTRGAGGFTGGYRADGSKIPWKSTEHNIDLVAMYRMLAKQSGLARYSKDSTHALHFVEAMWRPRHGNFAVGTGNNGISLNTDENPEDVNSWSYLALRKAKYAESIDWDLSHLATTSPDSHGTSFCQGDRSGVWYEGTAHLADALEVRGRATDPHRAKSLLADIRDAQRHGHHHDDRGIIAASKPLSDCDGDRYYPSLHVGATAWYVLAALGVNPLESLKPAAQPR